MDQHQACGCRFGPGLLQGRSSSCGAGLGACHSKPGGGDRIYQPGVIPASHVLQGQCVPKQSHHRVLVGTVTATGHQDKGPARAEVGTALCCSVSQYGLLVPPNPNWFFCLLPPTVPARKAEGPKSKPVRKMTKCLQQPGKDVAHLTKSFSGDCS